MLDVRDQVLAEAPKQHVKGRVVDVAKDEGMVKGRNLNPAFPEVQLIRGPLLQNRGNLFGRNTLQDSDARQVVIWLCFVKTHGVEDIQSSLSLTVKNSRGGR